MYKKPRSVNLSGLPRHISDLAWTLWTLTFMKARKREEPLGLGTSLCASVFKVFGHVFRSRTAFPGTRGAAHHPSGPRARGPSVGSPNPEPRGKSPCRYYAPLTSPGPLPENRATQLRAQGPRPPESRFRLEKLIRG